MEKDKHTKGTSVPKTTYQEITGSKHTFAQEQEIHEREEFYRQMYVAIVSDSRYENQICDKLRALGQNTEETARKVLNALVTALVEQAWTASKEWGKKV